MIPKSTRIFATVLFALLTACSGNNPGPLAGKWRLNGLMPMVVEFRSGETEAMGIIEKVSYEMKGNDVLVKYEDGLMKGVAVRYTMVGKDMVKSELGNLQRIN